MSQPSEFPELPELNSTFAHHTAPDPTTPASLISTPSPRTEDPPGMRKGPPVAPKPAWNRQSLRSIRNGRPQADQQEFLTFGVRLRPTSSAAQLSIKQKIHSFETFSSPEGKGQEREGNNRRPLAPSTSLPLKDKTTDPNAEISDSPSPEDTTTTPSTLEAPLPEADPETEPLDGAVEASISPSGPVPRRSSSSKGESFGPLHPPEEGEGDQSHAQAQGKQASLRTRSLPLPASPSPDGSTTLRGLEGESLGKILSFSNQVRLWSTLYITSHCPSQFEHIQVVILHKEEGAGLGFSIAGGIDLESKATTVHRVFPHGLAAQEGTVEKGDEVLSINGQTLRGATHADATATLRQARTMRLAVVVVSKGREGGGGEGNKADDSLVSMEDGGAMMTVELETGGGGIGFSLEGGKGSIHGDRPLVINRIFKGTQSGLQSGDELLQVQSTSLQELSRFEAWNIVKALPEGHITLVIRRRKEDEAEGSA
uniref:Interleukin 16 n=1 Tax=Hucho hucho TaxID=62062 RepID=A0A4W5KSI1_9TELE